MSEESQVIDLSSLTLPDVPDLKVTDPSGLNLPDEGQRQAPELSYSEKTQQVLQNLWKISQRGSPAVVPQREQARNPDILQTLWKIYRERVLHEPTGLESAPTYIRPTQDQFPAKQFPPEQLTPNQATSQKEESTIQGPAPGLFPRSLSPRAIRQIRDEQRNFLQKLGALVGEAEQSTPEQPIPNQPMAQKEEPALQGPDPSLPPRSLSQDEIKELRDEYRYFLQKLGVLPPASPGEKEAILRTPTQAEDISMAAKNKGESTIGAAPVPQTILESYESYKKKLLPRLAPWEVEETDFYDWLSNDTAPATSTEDWFERVLPSSLVKTVGGMEGLTAAHAVGTRMGETSLAHSLGKLSATDALLEDLKAVGDVAREAVKQPVKGVPGLNKDWKKNWATDPFGTLFGLVGLFSIFKGFTKGSSNLGGKAKVTEFLSKESIPEEQVAETFKAIEKARAAGGALDVSGLGSGETEAAESAALEAGDGRGVEEVPPGRIESTRKPYVQLAKNLEANGEPRPFGHAAHHIVALFAEGGKLAREILQKFDIPINSADNGVWLPDRKGVGQGAYHRELHSEAYYREVEHRLKGAADRDEALGILRTIKEELSKNRFPYKEGLYDCF